MSPVSPGRRAAGLCRQAWWGPSHLNSFSLGPAAAYGSGSLSVGPSPEEADGPQGTGLRAAAGEHS